MTFQTIRDIFFIVVVSIMLAIGFNYFRTEPALWFHEPTDTLDEVEINRIIDDSDQNESEGNTFGNKTLTYEQVKSYMNDERFLIIDARNEESYLEAHIPGAINIFPHPEDMDEFMATLFELPRDKAFIIYCNGGACDLSKELAEHLVNVGHDKLLLYEGGWEEWQRQEK